MSIYELIESAPEGAIIGGFYRTVPLVPKPAWTALGDMIRSQEGEPEHPKSNEVITLRLDVTGMSKLKKTLVRDGVLINSWDPKFAEMMCTVTESLARKYGARWAYTQSDEITIMIVPSANPDYQHPRGGKIQKLVSLAAAHASAVATSWINNHRLTHLVGSRDPILIEFDCRMAVWNSERAAFQLILWRAYDCGVNGVSDAVYSLRGHDIFMNSDVSYKQLIGRSTPEKLRWLNERGLVSFPDHQSYGTLYHRKAVMREGIDPRTGETHMVERQELQRVPANNVVHMVREGTIKFDE